MKLKRLVLTSLVCGMLCVISPLTIPIGTTVVSLATLVMYIAALTFDWGILCTAVLLYICMGIVGLPVFAGFTSGLTHLLGPMGGFIIGYLPMCFVISLIRMRACKICFPIAMFIGTILLYACGGIWMIVWTDLDIYGVLSVCVLPYIPIDVIKIVIALLSAPAIKKFNRI